MKFILVIILTLSPFLGLAQDGEGAGVDHTVQDEAMLNEIQKSREARAETIGKIEDVAGAFDPMVELKKIGYSDITAGTLLDERAIPILEKTLKEAHLSSVPPEIMKVKILESLEGHPLKKFLVGSPRILNFIVDVMRSEEVLLSGLSIFRNRPRMKLYLYFWIGIMFASYYTRRLFISKYWSKPARIFAGLLFSATISTITLSTFCLIFEPEMKPIIAIVKKHL